MKLSIITINYNNAIDLANTIESVINQTWTDFEYIVIDGGSTDGSVEVIKRHCSNIAFWVSEPDGGIYHAMNKGISKANGEYLLMLNSGDLLSSNSVLSQVFSLNTYNEDMLAGNVYRSIGGKIFEKSVFPDVLKFSFLKSGTLSHQATFIKKSAHDLVGLYDEELKYVSDWKFFLLAICKFNLSYRHLPVFVAVCDCSGLTCRPENFSHIRQENDMVLDQYFPTFVEDYRAFDFAQSKSIMQRVAELLIIMKHSIKQLIT